jgi:hypothetical protein
MSGPTAKPLADRFHEKYTPEPNSGCWLWDAYVGTSGYGRLQGRRGKPPHTSHRLSWELHFGTIPDDMFVLHRCDVRSCVNPDHLFIGSKGDNNRDAARKGRYPNQQKTCCPKGHPYSGVNLMLYKTKNGGIHRRCRKCDNDNQRRRYVERVR